MYEYITRILHTQIKCSSVPTYMPRHFLGFAKTTNQTNKILLQSVMHGLTAKVNVGPSVLPSQSILV